MFAMSESHQHKESSRINDLLVHGSRLTGRVFMWSWAQKPSNNDCWACVVLAVVVSLTEPRLLAKGVLSNAGPWTVSMDISHGMINLVRGKNKEVFDELRYSERCKTSGALRNSIVNYTLVSIA